MSELHFQIHGLTETRLRRLRKIAQFDAMAKPFTVVLVIAGFLTAYHYARAPDLSGLWKVEAKGKSYVVRIHQSMDNIASSYANMTPQRAKLRGITTEYSVFG